MKRDLTVLLLGAMATAWAAVPTGHTGGWGVVLLVVASLAIVAGTARVAFAGRGAAQRLLLPGTFDRLEEGLRVLLEALPWEVVASVSLVVLEVLHPSRPWHTAVLGLILTCYLLAVHRTEALVPEVALLGQGRLAGLGVVLLVLVAGIAMLPSGGSGTPAAWLEIVGALAAIGIAALALPL